jgi:hypothetical protein
MSSSARTSHRSMTQSANAELMPPSMMPSLGWVLRVSRTGMSAAAGRARAGAGVAAERTITPGSSIRLTRG